MAICAACGNEMLTAQGCVRIDYTFKGDAKVYPPIVYGAEADDWGGLSGRTCHDCFCTPGGFHHHGCDVERCPRCAGQAISCECDPEEI